MATVSIQLPHHQYDILIEPGSLDKLGQISQQHAPHQRCVLIVDSNVKQLHGQQVTTALQNANYQIVTFTQPTGEKNKTLDTVQQAYDVMLNERIERRSPVIALGGGVTGDTAGFVAATYLRGVPFIQCPTTLLAMVDASVGGKVGVNVPQGKNLIGAFYQPQVVVMDPLVLQTLSPRDFRSGLAECVKHGVIRDASLLQWIENNLSNIMAMEPNALIELLERNVKIKAAVVMEDEKESGVRAHLNFGHTFAHAIESTAGYGQFRHGEAVSLGMLAAAKLAADLKLCQMDVYEKLLDILHQIGLPTQVELVDTDALMQSMKLDKKVKDNRIRLVLPTGLGEVIIVDDAPLDTIVKSWDVVRK